MDFLRPFLFPVTICLIVVSMWYAALQKQWDAERYRARHTPPAWSEDSVAAGDAEPSMTAE